MARFTFGASSGDGPVTQAPAANNGFLRASLNLSSTGTFWSASTGGTQYTDLIDPNTSAALSGVSTDGAGRVVPFKGPDGVVEGWLDFGAGRFKVTAVDSGLYATQARAAVNVLDKGAKGDGATDDTAAIQSAINAAATLGAGVYFPQGTYIVSKPSGLDYMLEAKAGGRWRGEGTIRVSSTAGDYRALVAGASLSTDLSGLTIEGITFDLNNTGNPVVTNANLFAGYPRVCLYICAGSAITVRNCTFKDIDSVNTLYISGSGMSNIRIQDNLFTGVGTSGTVHDHSTIYVTADGMTVSGNTIQGVSGGKGATTAIETHGAGQVVANNRIRDFYCGMNITGVAANGSDGALVHDNVIRGVNTGIDLWSHSSGTGLRRAIVHDNNILIDHDPWLRSTTDYAHGIMLDAGIDTDIESLSIHDNHIFFKASVATAQSGELQAAGIALWASSTTPVLRNVRITNNVIQGSLSSGIRWQATGVRVRIEHNEIVDPGCSTDAGMASFYKSGITFGGTVTDMRVRGNRTFDSRGTHVISQGIMTSFTAVTRGVQGDNPVICADGAVVSPFVQTAGQLFSVVADAPVSTRFSAGLYYSPQGGRGTVATVNGTGTLAPFWVSQPNGFDRIGAQTTVAGAAATVIRLGIYADNGNGVPSSLILDAGTIAGDVVASNEITIAQTLPPGLYWLAAVPQGGAPTVTCMSASNEVGGGSTLAVATGTAPRSGYLFSAAGALPSTVTTTGQTAAATIVALRST